MSYPGNESLAPDIQARVLDTFQQTLKLVESDSRKEAELGCDFILRLDPLFEPARWLQDRLSTATGTIVLDDVKAAVADAIGGSPETDFDASLDDLDLAARETPDEKPEQAAESVVEPEVDESPAPVEAPVSVSKAAATQADTFGKADQPTPATAEEVLDAPVAALDTESEQRIQELLGEGHAAFERNEYQSAIDAWSRIFLIDIDHPEANQRIEQARKLKAEAERTVEQAFHEALSKIEHGDLEAGRSRLETVLEMQPDHLLAREHLEKLDAPPAEADLTPPAPAQPIAGSSSIDAPPPPAALDEPDLDAGLDLDQLVTPSDLEGQSAPIPIPKPRPPQKKAAADGDKKKLLLYVGAGVLALVLIGGWLLASNWSSFFPNSAETVDAPSASPDPIELAESMHAQGKASTAIAQLKRLPPHHELYSEAQALIARWEGQAQAATEDRGPTEADLVEFDSLIEQARNAQARREYLLVDELLTRAVAIQPLDENARNLKLVADAELEPLRTLVEIFRQGEWEMTLRELWRLHEDMPNNPDVSRLMVDSYYNIGVRALQRGDTSAAAKHFGEALEISSSDTDILRAAQFAQTYQDRPEDLLYRIFVKYVPFR